MSETTYSLRRKIAMITNAVTAFSNRPLVAIFYLGTIIVVLAGVAALLLVLRVVFFGSLLTGYASLIISVWLLGGLMIFCLGIIGIYLAIIFTESKERPYTIVRHVYSQQRENEP